VGAEWEQGRAAQKAEKLLVAQIKYREKIVERDIAAARRIDRHIADTLNNLNPIITEVIHEVTEVPVYRDCRITDDGMRNITDAVNKANSAIEGARKLRKDSTSN
jgi:t-SNARE complex subunit (syntaxin)